MRRFLRWLIVVAVPIILVVVAVRALTLPWFPTWEYGRDGFPDDSYGLEREERLRLAKACVSFLNLPRDLDRLEVLRLPDGSPAFTERELQHMDDVKRVYDGITIAGVGALVVALSAGWALYRRKEGPLVWGAISDGGLITLVILAALGIWMLISWNAFFTALHRVFFEGDSWLFQYSDTLIRLFPIRFWQDAGTLVAVAVASGAFVLALIGRMMQRRLILDEREEKESGAEVSPEEPDLSSDP